jgi:hypothetical protein
MERVVERCAGLDVHKDTVAAGLRVPGPGSRREQHVKPFGTTTADLLALRDWLEAHGVTHVAMESTGVWAAYHLLARGLPYRDLGADYVDRRHTERVTRRAVQALERQGYRVTLQPAA